jgi:hypothetical protein
VTDPKRPDGGAARTGDDIQVSVEDMLVDRDRIAVRSVLRGLAGSAPDKRKARTRRDGDLPR